MADHGEHAAEVTGVQLLPAPWKLLCPRPDVGPLLAVGLADREIQCLAGGGRRVDVCGASAGVAGTRCVERSSLEDNSYAAVLIGPHSATVWDAGDVARLLRPAGTAVWLETRVGGLTQAGFASERRYALLPPATGRIMLPLKDRKLTRTGLSFYTPGKGRNRLAMVLARAVARLGMQRLLGRRTVVAARTSGAAEQGVYLLDWLSNRLGTPVADATVHTGWTKRTLQLLDGAGGVIGVAKVGDSQRAKEVIERETAVLEGVGAEPQLRRFAPQVLAQGLWADCAVQVQSQAGSLRQRHSAALTAAHLDFLTALTQADRVQMTLARWPRWDGLREAVERAGPSLGADAGPAKDALAAAVEALRGVQIPFHRVHGDFAPWNVRLGGWGMMVVDWEESRAPGLAFYDMVYFTVRVARLLKGQELPLRDVLPSPIEALKLNQPLSTLSEALSAAGSPLLTRAQTEALVRLCLVEERLQD